jgi:hypothetical protein
MHQVVTLVARKDMQLDVWVQRCDTRHDRRVVVDIGAPIFADGQDVKAFCNALEEGAVFERNLDFFVFCLKEILVFLIPPYILIPRHALLKAFACDHRYLLHYRGPPY